jgi:hypothetical protein
VSTFRGATRKRQRKAVATHLSISSNSELMYDTVFSNLGMTTCSIALTRRLVALITSSRIVNAVCSCAHIHRSYQSSSLSTFRSTASAQKLGASHLQGSQFYQRSDRLDVRLSRLLNLLSTSTQTGQVEVCLPTSWVSSMASSLP